MDELLSRFQTLHCKSRTDLRDNFCKILDCEARVADFFLESVGYGPSLFRFLVVCPWWCVAHNMECVACVAYRVHGMWGRLWMLSYPPLAAKTTYRCKFDKNQKPLFMQEAACHQERRYPSTRSTLFSFSSSIPGLCPGQPAVAWLTPKALALECSLEFRYVFQQQSCGCCCFPVRK